MSDISRRNLARGAAWSVPAIVAAGTVPAVAASACGDFIKGKPLPASAFTGYYIVTDQKFGISNNKVIAAAAGISLTATAVRCIGQVAISNFSLNTTSGGTLKLTNGKSYSLSGGTGAAGSGTAGVRNNSCSGPNGVYGQACNTYISISVANSSGTSSSNPASASVKYNVTVAGFGTTAVTFNVSSFTLDGTSWDGGGITIA